MSCHEANMKIQKFVVWSSRILLNLLVCFLVSVIASDGRVSGQEKRLVKQRGSVIKINAYEEIPEATEPCTPDECEWWKQIREAGNTLQKKGDEKSMTKFALLLYEGLQMSYHVPLKDRSPQMLLHGKATYLEFARQNKIKGTVILSLEFRADGSVGDVEIVKKVGFGIEKYIVQATSNTIFLPAVQKGVFVDYRDKIEYNFSNRR